MNRRPRILVGATGGIAAFKVVELVRMLQADGAEVRCALTRAARSFVTPLTLEVLTGHAVYGEEYLSPTGSGEELHITLAEWADAVAIVPATAHALARLVLGLADDFLTTTVLAFDGPLLVAPAMHSAMWAKSTVKQHVAELERRGCEVVGPVVGPLANGEIGVGRMAEPAQIAERLLATVRPRSWSGRRVLITAGPTREAIDPVRFLTNHSSGKMGFAIARAAARRGATVTLVAGPVTLPTPAGVERLDVVSAREMYDATLARAANADLLVMTAAVSDFRPAEPSANKLKKRDGVPSVRLEPNPDILASLSGATEGLIVGFAAETDDLEANALAKLEAKGADFVVANDVSKPGIGFGADDNEVTVFGRDGSRTGIERSSKAVLAERLLDLLESSMELGREPLAVVDS